jgi:SAM-dependent methyltransferase
MPEFIEMERLLSIQDLSLRNRVETITQHLSPNSESTILDCGCGDGYYEKVLASSYGSRVVGLELDRISLRRAKVNTSSLGENVDLVCGDAMHLPFKSSVFKKCLMSEVLEHVTDDQTALEELKRVMTDDAVAVITVPNHDYPFMWDPPNWIREHMGLGHFSPWSQVVGGIWFGHLRLYTVQELVGRIKLSGFSIGRIEKLTGKAFPFSHNLMTFFKRLVDVSGLTRDAPSGFGRFTPERLHGFLMIPSGIQNILWRVDRGRKLTRSVNIVAVVRPD